MSGEEGVGMRSDPRRWFDSDELAELVPAATVVLVRDGGAGLETLMLRRNSTLDFAGGMWVFPGGRVDEADRDGAADELHAARRAAVREAEEEAGLLVDDAELVWIAHWQPPAGARRRFATWFFLAPAPQGGAVSIDGGEIHDAAWMSPAVAIARRDALEIELAPPTWVTLDYLSRFAGVDEAMAAARTLVPEHYETHIGVVDGGAVALWHGDAGYADSDASAEGARHRLWMLRTEPWRFERDLP
ncbi:MAG TPA: NUDIX hydrolase [Acidimicrobiia bacterium]|nr:NUDIX hydrolase [Acidimicrobiia bacterium]